MSKPRQPRRPERKPSVWSPRPIPQPAEERRTADPKTPTLKELAARAQQRTSLAASADATRVAVPAGAVVPVPDTEPQTLEAKKERLAKRRALVQGARDRATAMPNGPERANLLATAARFEDDTRAVDRMRLAKHVYDYYKSDGAAPPPLGFEQITSAADLARYGLKTNDLAPPGSDFRAALYRSELDDSGTPILAFRGTTSWNDWKANFAQGAGLESDYYARALNVGQKLARATDGEGGFATVGHSLGGGLASAVSARERVSGDTFNAAGVSETTLQRVHASRADGAGLVNAYHVDGEILTAVQDRDNQRSAVIASGAVIGPAAAGAIGMAREVMGNRILPTALGRMRTLPAIDPPEYQSGVGALNPYKYVNRHFSPTVIAGFEHEKADDSSALGAPALR